MALLPTRKRRSRVGARTNHAAACRHLTKVDPVRGSIISRVGSFALKPRSHHEGIWKRTYDRDKAGLAVSFMTST